MILILVPSIFIKLLSKRLIKLPLKVSKNFIKNSDKLHSKVYRTVDNIRTDYVFNFFLNILIYLALNL